MNSRNETDMSTSDWNTSIKNGATMPFVPSPKRNKWREFIYEFKLFFSAVVDLIVLLVLILSVPVVIFFAISSSVKCHRQIVAVENDLRSRNYEAISCGSSSYIEGELLARKRCDDKFGVGNYVFESTNFQGNVWYLAKPKENKQ